MGIFLCFWVFFLVLFPKHLLFLYEFFLQSWPDNQTSFEADARPAAWFGCPTGVDGALQFHPIVMFTHVFLPHMQFEVLKLVSAECFPLTLGFQRETLPCLPYSQWQGQVVLTSARILNLEKERRGAGWVSVHTGKSIGTLRVKSFLGCHLRSDLTYLSIMHGFLFLFLRGWG